MKKGKKLQIVNAVCGAGKSYTFKKIIESSPDRKFLVAMPTEKLILQFAECLTAPYKIAIRNDNSSATRNIKACVEDDFHINVILVTHEGLERYCREATFNNYLKERLNKFTVIIDEVPEAKTGADLAIKSESSFGFINTLKMGNGLLWADPDNVTVLMDTMQERETIKDPLSDICYSLLGGNGALFTDNRLISYALNPIFNAVEWAEDFIVCGAGVNNSEAATMLSQEGYMLTEADPIWQPDIKRNKHKRTSKITLVPAFDKPASMTAFSEVYTELLSQIKRKFKGKPFIYATNSDKGSDAFFEFGFSSLADDSFADNGDRVSMKSHGLNLYGGYSVHGLTKEQLAGAGVRDVDACFTGYTYAAYIGVVNPHPQTEKRFAEYCKLAGWDYEKLSETRHRTQNFESCYQFLCRTVIRDQTNNRECVFIVPDVGCAEYLKANYFSNCKIDPPLIMKHRKKMPERLQETLKKDRFGEYLLHKSQNKTQKEIATVMGIHVQTVKRYSKQYKTVEQHN